MVVLINADLQIHFSAKIDSFVIVFGNFLIAYFISISITKNLKNEELKINNCFKELDDLLDLISDLRENMLTEKNKALLEDKIIRFDSILSLQIELIKKYQFISNLHKEKLASNYYTLSKHLTNEDKVNPSYKKPLLHLEEVVLNIKSDILK